MIKTEMDIIESYQLMEHEPFEKWVSVASEVEFLKNIFFELTDDSIDRKEIFVKVEKRIKELEDGGY